MKDGDIIATIKNDSYFLIIKILKVNKKTARCLQIIVDFNCNSSYKDNYLYRIDTLSKLYNHKLNSYFKSEVLGTLFGERL